ncbi:MAG: TorF family putative porin [bacterium]
MLPYAKRIIRDAKDVSLLKPQYKGRSNLTQMEFVVYMDRLLSITNDHVSSVSALSVPSSVPSWARQSYIRFVTKFGTLSPFYFSPFSPTKLLTKYELARVIHAYLGDSDVISYSNPISFNFSFYDSRKGLKKLVDINILGDFFFFSDYMYVSKADAGWALTKAAIYKRKRFLDLDLRPLSKSSFFAFPVFPSFDFSFLNRFSISSGLSLHSSYVSRGLLQSTNDHISMSGILELNTSSPIYFGIALFTVDIFDAKTQLTSYELDYMLGYRSKFNVGSFPVNFNSVLTFFTYPSRFSTSQLEYAELSFDLSLRDFSFLISTLVSSDKFNFASDSYYQISYKKSFLDSFIFSSSLGYYYSEFILESYPFKDLMDYKISLSKKGFSFSRIFTNRKSIEPKTIISYSISL